MKTDYRTNVQEFDDEGYDDEDYEGTILRINNTGRSVSVVLEDDSKTTCALSSLLAITGAEAEEKIRPGSTIVGKVKKIGGNNYALQPEKVIAQKGELVCADINRLEENFALALTDDSRDVFIPRTPGTEVLFSEDSEYDTVDLYIVQQANEKWMARSLNSDNWHYDFDEIAQKSQAERNTGRKPIEGRLQDHGNPVQPLSRPASAVSPTPTPAPTPQPAPVAPIAPPKSNAMIFDYKGSKVELIQMKSGVALVRDQKSGAIIEELVDFSELST